MNLGSEKDEVKMVPEEKLGVSFKLVFVNRFSWEGHGSVNVGKLQDLML